MFGVLRLGLALLVVYAHLAGSPKYSHPWGIFAVFGFYIVSGYLMTLVLHTTYRFKALPFFTNRVLRLYPDYLLFAGLSLVAILLLPNALDYHDAFAVKTTPVDIFGNLFVVPFLFYKATFRLIPPTWSIAVELGYYFLLWLFIARRPSIALAVFAASVLFHGGSLYAGELWPKRYFPFWSAGLPFSIGALLFFTKERLNRISYGTLKGFAIAAVVLFFVNGVLCNLNGGTKSGLFDLFFYLNMVCLAVIIACLTIVRVPWPAALDRVLGDTAYPVFLCHWTVGFVVSHFVFDNTAKNVSLVFASLPFVAVCAWLSAVLSRRYIEPLRRKIRPRDARKQTATPMPLADTVQR